MSTTTDTAETCTVCKRQINREYGYSYCSEFCARENDKVKREFLAAKLGDYIVYPCPICGDSTEGEWDPDPHKTICSECAPKKRAKMMDAVLTDALPFLPEDLRKRAEEALKW